MPMTSLFIINDPPYAPWDRPPTASYRRQKDASLRAELRTVRARRDDGSIVAERLSRSRL